MTMMAWEMHVITVLMSLIPIKWTQMLMDKATPVTMMMMEMVRVDDGIIWV